MQEHIGEKENEEKEKEEKEGKEEKEEKKAKKELQTKHPAICGCNECFREEALNLGKLDEKKLTKLITTFISCKSSKMIKDVQEHSKECCCVVHLREKVKQSEGKTRTIQNLIAKYNEKKMNRNEDKQSKSNE